MTHFTFDVIAFPCRQSGSSGKEISEANYEGKYAERQQNTFHRRSVLKMSNGKFQDVVDFKENLNIIRLYIGGIDSIYIVGKLNTISICMLLFSWKT
jgi:hypothetical protein